MPLFFQENKIDLGTEIVEAGHPVYTRALYQSDSGEKIRVVYKKNKNQNPELSRFEAAFGEIASLFLPLELTAKQLLVKNDVNQVVGLCAEQIAYPIMRREGKNKTYFTIQIVKGELVCTPTLVASVEEVPFYFLRQFNSTIFKALKEAESKGLLGLNLQSIAGVLTASYSLEEDDLHKGNLGFYVVEKEGKPEVVFFKIDHDLMLADSVMSFCNTRFLNWFNGSDAFKVTARDLIEFPNIKDSQNYYWPTVKRTLSSMRPYAYSSQEEIEAFADLANVEKFKQEKWNAFYKHILIPPEAIKASIAKHLDPNIPEERAKIALITQSVIARQAKLRAVLFTIPEFRQQLAQLSESKAEAIKQSIMNAVEKEKEERVKEEINDTMQRYQKLCQTRSFKKGDTPLHTAIRLGDYRYHETHLAFSEFLHVKNSLGDTPLDLAASLARAKDRAQSTDVRSTIFCTMKHLLQCGAKKTSFFKKYEEEAPLNTNHYFFQTGYPSKARAVNDSKELLGLLREIGEDHCYSLKMQKQIAVICVRQFIESKKLHPNLNEWISDLKTALNGSKSSPPAPELNYVRQLRSQLWIVRIFRGLFGGTSTKAELNSLLDKAMYNSHYVIKNRARFFSEGEEIEVPDKGEAISKPGHGQ